MATTKPARSSEATTTRSGGPSHITAAATASASAGIDALRFRGAKMLPPTAP